MRRRMVWLLLLMFGLGVCGDSTVYAANTSDPLLTSPDFAGPPHPMSNYTWDADGVMGRFDPIYGLANTIFLIGVFLTRLSMWVLNLGYAPSQWMAPFQTMADTIQKNHFLDHLWPIFAVVAGGVLLKDLAQHNIQRMMRRGTMFVIVAVSLLLFQALGTVQYIKMVTGAIDALSYATSGWVLTLDQPVDPTKPQLAQASNNIDKEIWDRLVDYPWQLGEIGTPGKVLGKKDAEAVQGIVEGDMGVSPSTPWRDVLLYYSVGQDKRNSLAAILNNDDHPDSKAAFASPYRLTLALFALIAQLCAFIYMFALGIMMSMAYLLYLAAMLAGVVILPLAIFPWGYSHDMLRWWVKGLAGSVVVRLALGLYVGLTFLALKILTPNASATNGGAMGSMLLYPIIFVLALWILSKLWKRMQPMQRLTGVARAPAFAGGSVPSSSTPPGGGGPPSPPGGGGDSSPRRIDPDRQGSQDLPSLQEIWGKRKPELGKTLRKAGWKALRGDVAGAAASLATGVAKEIAKGSGETLKTAGKGYYDLWKATGGVSGESLKIAKDMFLKGGQKNKQTSGTSHQADAATGQENEERRNPRRPIDPDRLNWEGQTPETQDPAYWESLLRDDPRRPSSRDPAYWDSLLQDDPRRSPSQDGPSPRNADEGLNQTEPPMVSQDPSQETGQAPMVRETGQPDQESAPSAENDQGDQGPAPSAEADQVEPGLEASHREAPSVGQARRLAQLDDQRENIEEQARAVNPDADHSGPIELNHPMGAEEHVQQETHQNGLSDVITRQTTSAFRWQEALMSDSEPVETNVQRINPDDGQGMQPLATEENRAIVSERQSVKEEQNSVLPAQPQGTETTDMTETPAAAGERQQAGSDQRRDPWLGDRHSESTGQTSRVQEHAFFPKPSPRAEISPTEKSAVSAEKSEAKAVRIQGEHAASAKKGEETRTAPSIWREKPGMESDRPASSPSRKAPPLRGRVEARMETAEAPEQVIQKNPDENDLGL